MCCVVLLLTIVYMYAYVCTYEYPHQFFSVVHATWSWRFLAQDEVHFHAVAFPAHFFSLVRWYSLKLTKALFFFSCPTAAASRRRFATQILNSAPHIPHHLTVSSLIASMKADGSRRKTSFGHRESKGREGSSKHQVFSQSRQCCWCLCIA